MFGRYRRSPAIISDPALLNAPQGMVDPQDPGDPLGVGYVGEDEDTAAFLAAAKRMHRGWHSDEQPVVNLAEGEPPPSAVNGIVIGNLNDGYFRKFGTTMVTNPAMLVSPMDDYGSNLGDPHDVAQGLVVVGNVEDGDDDDDDRKDVFYNKRGNLRGRHKTKHLAKKYAKQDALENRKAIKKTERGLRQAGRAFDRMDRRFANAEQAEPSYADEAPVADAILAPVVDEVSPAAAAGMQTPRLWLDYTSGLEGDDAFAEAASVLDFAGLPAEDGPGDSAIVEMRSARHARKALRTIVLVAERISAEPMWIYADDSDSGGVLLAVSLEPFPAELGWSLAGVANGADPEAQAQAEAEAQAEVGLFGSKKRKAKRAAKAKMAAEAQAQAQAGELGALYYGTANITNPAFLTSSQADFDEDLGSPYAVRY